MTTNNKRILLVDDEPDIILAFKIGLEDHGFIVDAFDDPQTAASNFKCDVYDLLLLDIKMPKLNGLEFYYRMKEIDKKVKVCFITASEIYYYEHITKDVFNSLGVIRLFRKPIRIDDLANELKKEIGHQVHNGGNNGL